MDDLGIRYVLRESGASVSTNAPTDTEKLEEHTRKAVAVIVTALGDTPLDVVQDVSDNPAKMLAKLDERYNSKTMSAKISKMAEFVSMHYSDRSQDISKHIDAMASVARALRSAGVTLDDTMAVGVLIASIKVSRLAPVVAAIKTVAYKDMTWDKVATRPIEEWRYLPKNREETHRAVQNRCEFCGRDGHHSGKCRFREAFLAKWTAGSYQGTSNRPKRVKKREA